MADKGMSIACFGDSLTEGYGLSPNDALPSVLEQMLNEAGVAAHCLNFGWSGDTFGDGLNRLQRVIAARPDAVILEFGTNDFFMELPIKTIRQDFKGVVERLRLEGIPILLVGTKATQDVPAHYRQEFDPIFSEMAERYNLPLFPDILGCYLHDPNLTLLDGLHPNEQGIKAVCRALLPMVLALMNNARTRD